MSDKETMIYKYIRTQFEIDKVQILLICEDQFQIKDGVDTLTLTCDDRFNIIDVASGEIIAKRTLYDWQNVPGKFWN